MSSENDQLSVDDNTAEHRYEVHAEGQVAVLQYNRQDGRILLIHTEVPPALEGRGIAGMLARTALETARTDGVEVVPLCTYVAAYIRRHHEYLPLVAEPYRDELASGK